MSFAKNRNRKIVGVNERGYRVGESHHRAKLTNAQVDEIITMREQLNAAGGHVWSLGALARKFGVSKSTIRDIVDGRHRVQYPVAWRRVRADNAPQPDDNAGHEQRAEVHPGGS